MGCLPSKGCCIGSDGGMLRRGRLAVAFGSPRRICEAIHVVVVVDEKERVDVDEDDEDEELEQVEARKSANGTRKAKMQTKHLNWLACITHVPQK